MPNFVSKIAAVILLAGSVTTANAANIVETAEKAGKFNTLLAAAKAAGLVEALSQPGPLTVFAPSDEAFEKLPEGTVENLLKPENKQQLVDILTYHVLGRELTSGMLPHHRIPVRTLNTGARTLKITKNRSGVQVGNAKVVAADVQTDNGVIHIIDQVLLPTARTSHH